MALGKGFGKKKKKMGKKEEKKLDKNSILSVRTCSVNVYFMKKMTIDQFFNVCKMCALHKCLQNKCAND